MDVARLSGMKFKFFLISLVSSLGISLSFADSPANSINSPWFIGASVGVGKPDLQKASTTVPNGSGQSAPYDMDTYTANNPSSQDNLSLFAGYRWLRDTSFFPQYSLALRYQHLGGFGINGDITQYSISPAYANYSYHLNTDSSNLMLLSKIDLYQFNSILPYLSIGLGEANNKLSDYSEQAFSGIDPRVSPGYSGTNHEFAYSLGLGVDYNMSSNFSMSVGYEYANLGNLQANGAADSTWENTVLSFGHLASNTFLLSASYQLPL